jgi:argininosuccinate lyase
LQEDKPPLFDAMDTVLSCLELAAAMVEGAEFNRPAIQARIEAGHLDATTLMESLIRRGVPMRTAHEAVGSLVRKAIEQRATLAELSDSEFDAFVPGEGKALKESLGALRAVGAFQSYGSTAPQEVERQLDAWRGRLK